MPQEAAPSGPVQTLFVVDDDLALVESLMDVLSDEGYRIEGFTEPAEALARLREGARPAALLLDYLMPGMTGEEFIADLGEAGAHVPVLLLSGLSDPCIRVGAVAAVLAKPIDLDRLLAILGRVARAPAGDQEPAGKPHP